MSMNTKFISNRMYEILMASFTLQFQMVLGPNHHDHHHQKLTYIQTHTIESHPQSFYCCQNDLMHVYLQGLLLAHKHQDSKLPRSNINFATTGLDITLATRMQWYSTSIKDVGFISKIEFCVMCYNIV